MDITDRDQYLIDKYVQLQLSDEELIEFGNRRGDANFEKHFNFISDLNKSAKAIGREKIKEELEQWSRAKRNDSREEDQISHSPKRSNMYKYWGIAACLVGLIVFFFLMKSTPTSNNQLALTYYQKFPNVVDPITRSEDLPTNSYHLYETGRYNEAIEQLRTAKDDTSQFYLSLCYLEQNKVEESCKILEALRSKKRFLYRNQVNWYLAITYLRLNRKEEVQNLLRSLVTDNGPFTDKARSLLEDMDK